MRRTDTQKKRILFTICSILVFAALCLIPHYLTSYQKFLLTLALIYGLFAMSYDILLGYTGLLSVCHATQFGISAYGTLIVMEPPFIVSGR